MQSDPNGRKLNAWPEIEVLETTESRK